MEARPSAPRVYDDLARIIAVWRGRQAWLLGGIIVSLLALAAGVGLMAASGAMVAAAAATGMIVAPAMLRGLGSSRVVLRYVERLVTHAATFRALADLRVWFFRRLSATAAGGLGFRQAGDMLARLVGDVEALDGLYLRILVPLAGAALLFPALVILIGMPDPMLAAAIGALFLLAAFILPWVAARTTRLAGERLAVAEAGLRVVALDALTGLREVRAFGAEGRMLAAMQAREASLLSAQHSLAGHTALAGAAAFLCGQAAVFAVLVAAGTHPTGAIAGAFLVIAAFEAVGGLPRAGALAGHAAAAARRVLEAADAQVPVPDPTAAAPLPKGHALRFDSVHFCWSPDR
ncbi:MAG: ABC transporter transmembrane domain-containing protein, partial [Acetobacteraceae bacterium]